MIRISEQAARRAFAECRKRRSDWFGPNGLRLQLRMYRAAARAFGEPGRLDDFLVVYNGLRKWKLFRAGRVEDAKIVYGWLSSLAAELRQYRLSTLTPEGWRSVWQAIGRMRNVKPNKTGPSLMAISKFLHFWNPRLFVICDQGEVAGFVFGHRWLASQLDGVDWVLDAAGVDEDKEPALSQYLRVLAMGSEFVKANPHILPEFARQVHKMVAEAKISGDVVPADIGTFEATAVEWCLVGLAEMPPAGLKLSGNPGAAK